MNIPAMVIQIRDYAVHKLELNGVMSASIGDFRERIG
jgi:hypothetical protein